MDPFFVFVFLLLSLFVLSGAITQNIGLLVFNLTRSKNITVGFLALLFLPGTAVHELAHAAVAQMLGVHVGDIKLIPELDGSRIKMGSVQVAQTDPFRTFLIGAAPLVVGLFLIILLVALYSRLEFVGLAPSIILAYVLFEVGNTMFSSKRDMEGALELLVASILVFGLLYLVGVDQIFTLLLSAVSNMRPFFTMAASSLVKIVGIDIVVILIAGFFRMAVTGKYSVRT